MRKLQRQQALTELLADNPFLTDQELADHFGVSIQTVRLDRLGLGLPELRERVKQVAEEAYGRLRSVSLTDIIGDLVEINLDQSGISILDTDKSMAFTNSEIIRGHHIFAQANSLATALVDAEVALTGSAEIKYLSPAKAGERIVAKAEVVSIAGRKRTVRVKSSSGGREIFHGEFTMFAVDSDKQKEVGQW